jgi:hypothetical protein
MLRWTVEGADIAEAVKLATVRMDAVLPEGAEELRHPGLADDAAEQQRLWAVEECLLLLTVRRKDSE